MNLTKCFVAGLCVSALTASAAITQSDAFEGGVYSGNWLGVGLNYDPVAGPVVDGDAYPSYQGVRPLTDVTTNRVLKLDTEGGIWTNTVNQSFETNAVWVDMLVKFVPSEDLPTFSPVTDGKLAIAVKADAGGTNLLNIANNNGFSFTWNPTAREISTSEWYRVTVKLYYDSLVLGTTAAQVSINGTDVGTPLELNANTTLFSIGFQGTGFIDEVVVRDDPPSFGSTTVAFGGSGPLVDQAELTAWKGTNSIIVTENPNSFNAFVMNVAPETNGDSPVLVVSSISVGGTTTLEVMAKYADGHTVVLGSPLYNGAVLTVWGRAALETGTWQNLGTTLDGFNQPTYKFFMVTTGTNPNPI